MTHRLATVSVRVFSSVLCVFAAAAVVACGGGGEPAENAATAESPADLEARAQQIHERVITIDTHVDIPGNFATPGEDDPGLLTNRKVDLPKMREGGLDTSFFIVYVGQPRTEDWGLNEEAYTGAYEVAMQKFDGIHRLAEEMHPDEIGLGDLGKRDSYVGRQLRTWYRSWTSSMEPAAMSVPRDPVV